MGIEVDLCRNKKTKTDRSCSESTSCRKSYVRQFQHCQLKMSGSYGSGSVWNK